MKPLNLKVLNAEAIAKVKGGRRNGEGGHVTIEQEIEQYYLTNKNSVYKLINLIKGKAPSNAFPFYSF